MLSATKSTMSSSIEPKQHYPFITRLLIELYQAGALPDVQTLDIEPIYGYVGRLVHKDGTARLFRGKNLDINRSSSSEIAKDKGYAKYFLQLLGYQTPSGKVFLLPEYVATIDRNLSRYGFADYSRVEQIFTYIHEHIGYPCFIKPNTGSQGRGVSKCFNDQDVEEILMQYQQEGIPVLLVEESVDLPDYRVVVLKGEIISCYLRKPLAVNGDGRSTIRNLLDAAQQSFVARGRDTFLQMDDPRILRQAQRHGYTLETVLPLNTRFQVYDASNLSLGGEPEDYTNRLHQYWKELCISVARDMGLLLCGVDIACANLEAPEASYSILEINAAPGLDNYAASGEEQSQAVRALYQKVFNKTMFL